MDHGLDALAQLDGLALDGARHLWELSGDELLEAWWAATDDLVTRLPPALLQSMADAAGLSPQGLSAGLDVVVRGVRTEAARAMLRSTRPPTAPLAPALVVLASNLPGLALQCLLPALAARRPLLLKTPSSEPDFTPWFLRRLTRIEPRLGSALAAATWRGGDRGVEEALLRRVERVVAYGSDGAVTDLGHRLGGELVGHGHRISVGIVMSAPEGAIEGFVERFVEDAARGLARDVALFDQRGCLSVHSVLATPDVSETLARSLADQLSRLTVELPPGPAAAGQLASVRAAREEAVMAGHKLFELPLRHGTVILDTADRPEQFHLESPGLRTVRVVPVSSRDVLLRGLGGWRGRIQGVALAASSKDVEASLAEDLLSLGVTRIALAGHLQEVDAAVWENGGRSPLSAYSEELASASS